MNCILGEDPTLLIHELLHLSQLSPMLELFLPNLTEDIREIRVLKGATDPPGVLIIEPEVLSDELLEKYLVGLDVELDALANLGSMLARSLRVPKPVAEVSKDIIEGLEVVRILA